jgi:hypothetical protein
MIIKISQLAAVFLYGPIKTFTHSQAGHAIYYIGYCSVTYKSSGDACLLIPGGVSAVAVGTPPLFTTERTVHAVRMGWTYDTCSPFTVLISMPARGAHVFDVLQSS